MGWEGNGTILSFWGVPQGWGAGWTVTRKQGESELHRAVQD